MEDLQQKQKDITELGNPRKPQGENGARMLERMNDSHAAVTAWAFDHLTLRPDDRILDVGCGGGAALSRLSRAVPDGHLVGVDYSPLSVEQSRSYNRADVESGKMEILEGSVEALPFPDGSFDKVVTVESFYFWPKPVESLREIRRTLKADGVFLLVADIYQKDGLPAEALENIRKFNLHNPTYDEYLSLFAEAGFSKTAAHLKEGTDWICIEGHR